MGWLKAILIISAVFLITVQLIENRKLESNPTITKIPVMNPFLNIRFGLHEIYFSSSGSGVDLFFIIAPPILFCLTIALSLIILILYVCLRCSYSSKMKNRSSKLASTIGKNQTTRKSFVPAAVKSDEPKAKNKTLDTNQATRVHQLPGLPTAPTGSSEAFYGAVELEVFGDNFCMNYIKPIIEGKLNGKGGDCPAATFEDLRRKLNSLNAMD